MTVVFDRLEVRTSNGSAWSRLRSLATAWLTTTALALWAQPALADAALPAGVQFVTAVEGISEYRLDNGLKVLLFPDPSKPTLTVNITYLVGSRHENYGETGMAHLLEHLMFKGTAGHRDIPAEFTQRGARFNGTTSLDRTNYFELVPATDDNLRWAIELEADRMVNSFIARKDLDSEMTVVRNEYEIGETRPYSVLSKRIQSLAYDWHSYGRSTIGARSDIENVRIENLQAFYRTYYQPDNAVLLVAGKFDPAAALQLVSASFGKIAKPQRTLPSFWTIEPTQDGERNFVVRRKDDMQIVWVAYKVPSSLHANSLPLMLGAQILGHTPNGRLYKALVQTGKATAVYAFNVMGSAPGLQVFGAEVKKGEPLEPVRDALVREIETAYDQPATAEELDRARTAMLNQMDKQLANHESIGIALSEVIALGDWRLFFKARDEVRKLTPAQIAPAAQRYYLRDNRTVGMYLPEDHPHRAEIAAAPTAAEVLKDYRPVAQAASAEAFDPSPANIDSRTERTTAGGLKLALLPKKNRGETVAVRLRLHWGDEKSLFGKRAIADLTNAMIGRGTAKMTRAQLADQKERLKMSGDFLAFDTTGPMLPDALRLAAHALRDASFPPDEFEQLKKQTITGLEAQRADPGARANDAIRRHYNRYPKGDPRYRATIDERIADVQAVTLDQIKQFHADFYGASGSELAIVGDFDPARARAVVQEEFGAWAARMPYAPVLTPYAEVAPARLPVATPDKENAVIIGMAGLDLRQDAPDYADLIVANTVIGSSGMSSRLMRRLRQKDGLSYGVGSGLDVSARDNNGAWFVYAMAAPKNAAKAEAAIREEVALALERGFTASEIKDAIANVLQMNRQSRAQDGAVAGLWSDHLHLGRSFTTWSAPLEQRIAAVSPESALAALRKYLRSVDRVSIAVAADPAKQ